MRYGDFRPTGFDPPGAFLPERREWIVAPVSRTRDSGPLDQSNFEQALEALGGESETVEVRRFGHWGPGWFEIILVDPQDAERIKVLDDLREALENYPVLNDEDFSRREQEDYSESWESWGYKDFVRQLVKDFELGYAATNVLEDIPVDGLRTFFEEGVPSGEYYIGEDSGVSVNFWSFDCSRGELAAFLWKHRRKPS